MTDYLRISGMYWGLTSLALMNHSHVIPEKEVIEFIRECYDKESGGISGGVNHDPHLLHTLSAIQVKDVVL